jgi:hypothetical protein
MVSAKHIIIKPITSQAANDLVKRVHYSGKVVNNSVLHFGAYLDGNLEGAMSFGGSIDKRKVLPLVSGTSWNGMLELNRMAFSDRLPRNSESRCMAIAFKMIKKHYPHIEWVLSFADGCQCGDGTIYRAAGFVLTGVKTNKTMLLTPDGEVVADKTFNNNADKKYKGLKKSQCKPLLGYQLRYIYFLNAEARQRLTVPVLPFSKIDEIGAGMYKGKPKRMKQANSGDQPESGGAAPTHALQSLQDASI